MSLSKLNFTSLKSFFLHRRQLLLLHLPCSRFLFTFPSFIAPKRISQRKICCPVRNSICLVGEKKSYSRGGMAIADEPHVRDGRLMVRGKVVLKDVPENVIVSPSIDGTAAFLGASSKIPSCRHVFTLGVLQGYKFLSLFRFKIWWMIPRVGQSGGEIPMETQLLLLEAREEAAIDTENCSQVKSENTFYILLLPTLDGSFRATLQGNPGNQLECCVESGDAYVQTSEVRESVFINSGNNPFELIKNSIKILEKIKGTFSHIEHKKHAKHLDWFGWCTWDAFYKDVNPRGIEEGLQSFREGGCVPKFLVIDDGWQDTVDEFQRQGKPFSFGMQFAERLVDIKENKKFKGADQENSCSDLREFIGMIKEKYGLEHVYMWHALAGYWGGVDPSSEMMQKYNPKIVYPIQSPGNTGNIRDVAMDSLEKYGVGLIDPSKIFEFYNNLHSYLASTGVTGVKVDVQNVMETLGAGYGGRVSITKQYQQALEQSITKNFKDNNLISCMSHNTDSLFSSKCCAVARASEDFMPNELTFQTLHVASASFNSLLLGELVVPDWDMFHSNHSTADFHAAARAVGGCAVYVSDKPGMHDFEILKRLVLPDGSVLRARYAGRPTRDCLFVDPVVDGKSLLKIWNLNKLTGVIGVFNCQGAGCWPWPPRNEDQDTSREASMPSQLSTYVSPHDVEFLDELGCEDWSGDFAVYAFNSGSLTRMSREASCEVSLRVLTCEIFTISPIRVFNKEIQFAPIGLLDMYNSGGGIETLNCSQDVSGCKISIKGRGTGRFGAYSSAKPKSCVVNMKEEEFKYNAEDGLLIIEHSGEIELVY